MSGASPVTLVFDPLQVALADVSDRPGMPSASVGKLRPAAAAPLPVRRKVQIVAPAPKSVPAPVEIIAAPQPAKPRAAIIAGQQQKRLAAEKGGDGRPIRPYAIRPGFIAAPASSPPRRRPASGSKAHRRRTTAASASRRRHRVSRTALPMPSAPTGSCRGVWLPLSL